MLKKLLYLPRQYPRYSLLYYQWTLKTSKTCKIKTCKLSYTRVSCDYLTFVATRQSLAVAGLFSYHNHPLATFMLYNTIAY